MSRTNLSLVVGCDPDTRFPSYALLRDRELQAIRYETGGPRVRPPMPREALVVVERQFVVPGSRVPPADIIELSWAAGECSMHFDRCEKVSVNRWKGQTPKRVCHGWVMDELSDAEKYVLVGLSKTQWVEVLDAVGIALWRVGRLK